MEDIKLFDLNKEEYENQILKKKIIIICVIGIIVILNIINFLTKKILGLYIPLFSIALIITQVFEYIMICLNQKYILSIYSNKIDINKEDNNILITLNNKTKKFKKIKIVKSSFKINRFNPLTNILYLKNDLEEIKFEYKENPIKVKETILKKCLIISGLIYLTLEVFFIFILKYIPLFLMLSFSWLIIIAFITIIIYETLIEKNRIKIFEKILNNKIFIGNDKFYYLENYIYNELFIESNIGDYKKDLIIDIKTNKIEEKET